MYCTVTKLLKLMNFGQNCISYPSLPQLATTPSLPKSQFIVSKYVIQPTHTMIQHIGNTLSCSIHLFLTSQLCQYCSERWRSRYSGSFSPIWNIGNTLSCSTHLFPLAIGCCLHFQTVVQRSFWTFDKLVIYP